MSGKIIKDFNNEDFRTYSNEHIFYEIDKLLKARDFILLNGSSGLLNMFAIESFVIHLRNLIFFLYPPPPPKNHKNTDIYAKYFLSDPEEWKEVISESLKKARARANKEVEHLTTQRIAGAPPEKIWPVAELTEEILPILKSFCDRADRGKLDMVISKISHDHWKVTPGKATL
ncbi:MAG: hypothetical protein HYT46_00720 [Candidatus Vogelbacteria bacterium]|nr:hypothetical protein [Candidatus Vogelbacteria bacterium]